MMALILAIVGLSIALKISQSEVAIHQGTIETLSSQKQTLQQDLNNASAQLLVAEQENTDCGKQNQNWYPNSTAKMSSGKTQIELKATRAASNLSLS